MLPSETSFGPRSRISPFSHPFAFLISQQAAAHNPLLVDVEVGCQTKLQVSVVFGRAFLAGHQKACSSACSRALFATQDDRVRAHGMGKPKHFPKAFQAILRIMAALRLPGLFNNRAEALHISAQRGVETAPRNGELFAMDNVIGETAGSRLKTFGRRKMTPRVCVVDSKRHLRAFMSEVLADLGFVTSECSSASELQANLTADLPDLVLLGIAADRNEPGQFLEVLVREAFEGKVLAVGARDSIIVKAVQQVGEEYGLGMLPPLTTPFAADTLRERVNMLLPADSVPSPAVHVGEALHGGWLELWYQSKIDARSLVRRGAEAKVRLRHPTWGVVRPAHFIPEGHDPYFCDLSEFVIERALQDWHYLLEQQSAVDLAINLPAPYLRKPQAVRDLCRRMPMHPAFDGLTIEIASHEAIKDLDFLAEIAREMSFYNIGLSIDKLGANWPELMGLDKIPFIKLKADRQFVAGCGKDRLKRTVCRHIVELAQGYGARAVAEGIESGADLAAVNELGFDLVQGYLFGKPMPVKKFARNALTPTVMEQE